MGVFLRKYTEMNWLEMMDATNEQDAEEETEEGWSLA